jgi:stage II sporulation protein D
VVLKGHGFGHGAGMCQWGAKVLAEKGKTFREILSHYYPGTELQTLY